LDVFAAFSAAQHFSQAPVFPVTGPAATGASDEAFVADATMRLWKRDGAALAMPAVKIASVAMTMNFFMLLCCVVVLVTSSEPVGSRGIMENVFIAVIKATIRFPGSHGGSDGATESADSAEQMHAFAIFRNEGVVDVSGIP
jgi:hypothetical protein